MNSFVRSFHSRLISLWLSCCVLLACCGAPDAVVASVPGGGAANAVRLEREFKLRPGQQVSVKGTKLRIKFTAVNEDSRCPLDVTCVWAGNAMIRLWITSGRGGKALILNTNKSSTLSDEAQFQGFKLRLVTLSPYPRTDQKIAPSDYTATLLVSRN